MSESQQKTKRNKTKRFRPSSAQELQVLELTDTEELHRKCFTWNIKNEITKLN